MSPAAAAGPAQAPAFSGLSATTASRGQEQGRDRGGVLQRGARHLGGVDDAGLQHVDRTRRWRRLRPEGPPPGCEPSPPRRATPRGPALTADLPQRSVERPRARCWHRSPRSPTRSQLVEGVFFAGLHEPRRHHRGRWPSSTAAFRVCERRSSMRCLRSLSSTSVGRADLDDRKHRRPAWPGAPAASPRS